MKPVKIGPFSVCPHLPQRFLYLLLQPKVINYLKPQKPPMTKIIFLFHQERWPHNNYIKKLQRKDGYYIYFNRTRECADKDVNKCKMYGY